VFNLEGANEPIAVRELAFPVMDEVKNVGMYGILTTNGTLFTERDIKRLVQIAWDRIHFSIDSFDQKIHDQLRGRSGTFKRAVKAIKLLNKYKRKLKTDRPMLNINIVINKLNYFSLPRMVQFCHKLKADYIFVEPLIIFSDGGKKIKLSREQTEKELPKYVQEAKRLADGYGIDNNFATQDENLRKELVEEAGSIENVLIDDVESISNGTILSSPCFKPWTRMAIKYDGLTGHCGLIQAGEDVKVKSLEEIWFGQWLNRIRKRMIRKQLLEHCSHCIPSDITQRRRFRAELKQAIGEKIGKNN
jgi:MoaA/NifB/PqqE/SkfB family radical SAM enzyme